MKTKVSHRSYKLLATVLALALPCATTASAQVPAQFPTSPTFMRTYDFGAPPRSVDELRQTFQLGDGQILAVGYETGINFQGRLFFATLDLLGNPTSVKHSALEFMSSDIEIFRNQKGEYFIGGRTGTWLNNVFTLTKLARDGRQLWEWTAYLNYRVFSTSDGGCLIANMPRDHDLERLYVAKLDANGVMEWERNHDISFPPGLGFLDVSFERVGADGHVLGGSLGHLPRPAIGFSGSDNFYLLKIDAQGEQEWFHRYSFPGSSIEIPPGMYSSDLKVKQDEDGNFVGIGQASEEPVGDDGLIFKVDASGSLLWQRRFGIPGNYERLFDVEVTHDGGYAVAGSRFMGPGFAFEGYLFKLGPDGNILYERTFPSSDPNYSTYCWNITEMKNGDLLLSGLRQYQDDFVTDSLLIRVHANGDL